MDVSALIQTLYTNFLLRDFAGKIVPGAFLAFSLATMVATPMELLRIASSRLSTVFVAAAAGLFWITVLGLQSIAESACLWSYFPSIGCVRDETKFAEATRLMQQFLAIAEAGDKLQYERFVVIKEATGNLLMAMLLSIPFWIRYTAIAMPQGVYGRSAAFLKSPRVLLSIAFFVLVAVGLHRMNAQHVTRQYCLAVLTLQAKTPAAVSNPEVLRPCTSGAK